MNTTTIVDDFIKNLDHPFKAELAAVRNIILQASVHIEERIKWNAPSFYYKKDFAAFTLHKKEYLLLVLIFPNGLLAHDYGVLEGEYTDRRLVTFHSMEEVEQKKAALELVVKDWVTLMNEAKIP